MADESANIVPLIGHYCTDKNGVRGLILDARRNGNGDIECDVAWWTKGDSTYYTSTESLDSLNVE